MTITDTLTVTQDIGQVNIYVDYEILYWCGFFGCRPEELREAVERVGDHADAVGKELQAIKVAEGFRRRTGRRKGLHLTKAAGR